MTPANENRAEHVAWVLFALFAVLLALAFVV